MSAQTKLELLLTKFDSFCDFIGDCNKLAPENAPPGAIDEIKQRIIEMKEMVHKVPFALVASIQSDMMPLFNKETHKIDREKAKIQWAGVMAQMGIPLKAADFDKQKDIFDKLLRYYECFCEIINSN